MNKYTWLLFSYKESNDIVEEDTERFCFLSLLTIDLFLWIRLKAYDSNKHKQRVDKISLFEETKNDLNFLFFNQVFFSPCFYWKHSIIESSFVILIYIRRKKHWFSSIYLATTIVYSLIYTEQIRNNKSFFHVYERRNYNEQGNRKNSNK